MTQPLVNTNAWWAIFSTFVQLDPTSVSR
ncbi:hypothetical protein LINPERHAP2_LOCUS33739 [Linum perenne]